MDNTFALNGLDFSPEINMARYLQSIRKFPILEQDEEFELATRYKETKDEKIAYKLVTSHLRLVVKVVSKYRGYGLPLGEMISEGNIGLLLAMDTLDTFDSPAACQAHLLNCVNQAMEDAIHANEETKKSNEGIVSRVNHLNEAIHNLEEELEHKVSVDELSAYLEMPAAEIEDVLRMSGDQIEIEKNR